jgi:hypothetical protein
MAGNGALPPSVAPSVPSSTGPTDLEINSTPQLGPLVTTDGAKYVPAVGNSGNPEEAPEQPGYGKVVTHSAELGATAGNLAPSLPPMNGVLFRRGPIDAHYLSENEARNPYKKVNNPPTRGMLTWVKTYANHVFNGKQNVNEAGWQQNSPQQRTSYMRFQPPPHGMGYDPASSAPRQLPQVPYTQRFVPQTGTDPYGSGVLNADTFGAGQVYAGQGGNQYSPAPGQPETNSTADQSAPPSGEATWG